MMKSIESSVALASLLCMFGCGSTGGSESVAEAKDLVSLGSHRDDDPNTATPIKHVVVIFNENISFDHYFATYPHAKNLAGETPFIAKRGTPHVNNLTTPLDPTHHFRPVAGVDLLNNNPNFTNTANGTDAANPFRLSPAQAATQDQGHNYKPEQQASDNGAMDLFPEFTGTEGPPPDRKSVV